MPDEILGAYNLGSRRPPQVGTLIDPFKSTRVRKPKEPATDILAAFEREDMIRAIWGKPYDGPVRNTKAKPSGDR